MKQFVIALLLVMLWVVVGNALNSEDIEQMTNPTLHVLEWNEEGYPWGENITLDITIPKNIVFRIFDYYKSLEIDIEIELISNTTMVLKTPIEIQFPDGELGVWFSKGTKIIVGE